MCRVILGAKVEVVVHFLVFEDGVGVFHVRHRTIRLEESLFVAPAVDLSG